MAAEEHRTSTSDGALGSETARWRTVDELLAQLLSSVDCAWAIHIDLDWSRAPGGVVGLQGRAVGDAGDVDPAGTPMARLAVAPGAEPRLLEHLEAADDGPRLLDPTIRDCLSGLVALPGWAYLGVPVKIHGLIDSYVVLGHESSRPFPIHDTIAVLPPVLAGLARSSERTKNSPDPDPRLTSGLVPDALREGLLRFGADHRIRHVTSAAARMLHATPESLVGVQLDEVLPRSVLHRLLGTDVVSDDGVAFVDAVTVRRGDDTTTSLDVCRHGPVPTGAGDDGVLSLVDRSEIERVTHRADMAVARVRAFADHAPVGLLQADESLYCTYVNQRWCELHGVSQGSAMGLGWISGIPVGVAEDFLERMRTEVLAGRPFSEVIELRSFGNHTVWGEVLVRPVPAPDGSFGGITYVAIDVTQQQESEQRLRSVAEQDSLTSLANRFSLEARFAAGRRATDDHRAVIYIDLDGFKAVNDSYGHAVGDELLKEVARRLRTCARRDDFVARLGGDEFVIVAEGGPTLDGVERIVADVQRELGREYQLGPYYVFTSPSVGVAVDGTGGVEFSELLRRADVAMYQAKEAGKNTVAYFTPALSTVVSERTDTIRDLHRALSREQFGAHFQLVFDAESLQPVGAEALLRWEAPGRHLMSPADFVPLLEDHGLIADVGHLVLRDACRAMATWLESGALGPDATVAVNVSNLQLRRPGWFDGVRDVLRETGLPPRNLTIEVTESVVLSDLADERNVLDAVRELGATIAIDDFGTGYSSLAALRRLPVDVIKIDEVFVRTIAHDERDRTIVASICGLARDLGIAVVAEGVSSDEHVRLLRQLGCRSLQGHHLYHPASPDDVAHSLGAFAAPPSSH